MLHMGSHWDRNQELKLILNNWTQLHPRMHSSRMRTVPCIGRLEGGCLPRGCTPPCGQIDACENITFPQLLLRTVKMCTPSGNSNTNIVSKYDVVCNPFPNFWWLLSFSRSEGLLLDYQINGGCMFQFETRWMWVDSPRRHQPLSLITHTEASSL